MKMHVLYTVQKGSLTLPVRTVETYVYIVVIALAAIFSLRNCGWPWAQESYSDI